MKQETNTFVVTMIDKLPNKDQVLEGGCGCGKGIESAYRNRNGADANGCGSALILALFLLGDSTLSSELLRDKLITSIIHIIHKK